jgi:hypothetical protein
MYSAQNAIAIAVAIQEDIHKLGLGAQKLNLTSRRQDSLPKGVDYARLQAALVSAFTRESLPQMVKFVFNENLEAIAGGSNFSSICFNLIGWAERHGRLQELIAGAKKFNPTNPTLSEFVDAINVRS